MLPPGPLVIVIVPGGADVTKRNTAPATTRTANRIAAMVMARLTPNISIIIVSRLGLVVGEPPAAGGPLKSVESLSLLIRRQRSLPDPLEQGENPGRVPGKRCRVGGRGWIERPRANDQLSPVPHRTEQTDFPYSALRTHSSGGFPCRRARQCIESVLRVQALVRVGLGSRRG